MFTWLEYEAENDDEVIPISNKSDKVVSCTKRMLHDGSVEDTPPNALYQLVFPLYQPTPLAKGRECLVLMMILGFRQLRVCFLLHRSKWQVITANLIWAWLINY